MQSAPVSKVHLLAVSTQPENVVSVQYKEIELRHVRDEFLNQNSLSVYMHSSVMCVVSDLY